jgi:hypothetical protein
MPFEPEKITKEHVLEASKQISNGTYAASPSTGYNVIINDKPFPPKEILRIAHKLATGEIPEKIVGGEPTNKWLRELGFDIQSKNNAEQSSEGEINTVRNFYKYSPGPNASRWAEDQEMGIMAINFSEFKTGNLNQYKSHEDLGKAIGVDYKNSNTSWNLWLFKEAKIGDVIIANNGVNIVLGFGIIRGIYEYDSTKQNYRHTRKVKWIADKEFTYKQNTIIGYQELMRRDTFSTTKIPLEIVGLYLDAYPEYVEVFKENGIEAKKMGINYYVFGASWNNYPGGADQTQRFIENGIWENGHENKFIDLIKNVRVGDRIAIKAKWAKGSISYLRIKALGTVTANPGTGNKLFVKWDSPFSVIDLKIGKYWETCHEVTDKEDINKIFFHKNLNHTINNSAMQPKNIILYGPPGTGKTFKLQSLFEEFTDRTQILNAEEILDRWLRESTWWVILAHVLYNSPKGLTVPELKQNELIKAKFAQSDIKNASARLWSTLQHHTVTDCKTVAHERRLNPPLFWKEDNSQWRIANKEQFALEYPELLNRPDATSPALKKTNVKRYIFATAHQSLSYEDFVEGIKPVFGLNNEQFDDEVNSLNYNIKNGLFYEACDNAARLAGFKSLQDCINASKEDRQQSFANAPKFSFFIDEINRCNISAVLGELITLLEDDKRLGSIYEITDTQLPYSQRLFGVPANLYIYGTMNTADRSVEALDTALRRRFSFVEMPPIEDHDLISNAVSISGIHFNFRDILKTINKRLEKLIGRDHKIGHSYFIDTEKNKDWEFYLSAFKNKIIPLMQEYFYGDYLKMCLVLGKGFVNIAQESNNDNFFAEVEYEGIEELNDKKIWQLQQIENENAFSNALTTLLNKS